MAMTDLGNLTGDGGALFDPSGGYSLSNLYKQVYTDLIRLQIQQYDSVLSDTLMGETIEGEVKSFDKYLKHDVSKIKSRARFGELGTTGNEYSQTDSERRLIEPLFFEYSELFDPRDEVGLLRAIAPDGQYLRNIGAIFNQKKDLLILDALKNDVLVQTRTGDGVTANTTMAYGTNTTVGGKNKITGVAVGAATGFTAKGGYEGLEIGCKLAKTNATSKTDKTPFIEYNLTDNVVKVAGTTVAETGTNTATEDAVKTALNDVTPMNIEKLIRARQKLDANNALMPGMPYICLMHPNNFYSLMSDADDTRFTSIDFNEGKPLFGGEAFVFMGFQFRLSNLLPELTVPIRHTVTGAGSGSGTLADYAAQDKSDDASIRYVYFYTPACGVFGMNQGMQIRFDEIPERGYALQMYHAVGMNGIRMDGDCMVRVACVDEGA
jgi:hypothetical protein